VHGGKQLWHSMSCGTYRSPCVLLLSAFGAVILVISARFRGELESLLLQGLCLPVREWPSNAENYASVRRVQSVRSPVRYFAADKGANFRYSSL
jgi:hypothetical protein